MKAQVKGEKDNSVKCQTKADEGRNDSRKFQTCSSEEVTRGVKRVTNRNWIERKWTQVLKNLVKIPLKILSSINAFRIQAPSA